MPIANPIHPVCTRLVACGLLKVTYVGLEFRVNDETTELGAALIEAYDGPRPNPLPRRSSE
jgi:hypothetical protein